MKVGLSDIELNLLFAAAVSNLLRFSIADQVAHWVRRDFLCICGRCAVRLP